MIRQRFPERQELSRKAAHILCGLTALSFPHFINSHWIVLGLVLVFSALMWVSKKKNLLPSIHEVGRTSYGSFYYPIAIYLIFFLASHKPAIYLISILVLTISDALAALLGKKYGTIKYEVEGNTKSLEGSAAFFFVTFLAVQLPLLLMTDIGNLEAILISFIISALVTGFEAISPTGSDNIIIPFGTYFILTKMIPIPLDAILWYVYALIGVIAITAAFSRLKPSGLIAVMLINYASLSLCNFYWFIPLILCEIVLFFLMNKQKRFSVKTIFRLGITPTLILFISNTLHDEKILYVPYVISIAGQIPLICKGRASLLAALIVVVPSLLIYEANGLAIALLSIGLIYLFNRKFNQETRYA